MKKIFVKGNEVLFKNKKVKIVELGNKDVKLEYLNEKNIEELGNSPFSTSYENIEQIENSIYNSLKNNKKNIKKANISIEPSRWTPLQSKYFPDWILNAFSPYILNKSNAELKTKINKSLPFKPFKHQEFLRDYLQYSSPYRGILLYHGLGSGKTCTSITIAEGLRKHNYTVVIMLPASLKPDFLQDGLMFCADPKFKEDPESIFKYYSFVSYNASNKLEQLRSLGSLDDKLIIIEEAHNFIGQVANGSYIAKEMYETLMKTQRTKIVALSGTPMINEPFEVALMMNLLRGNMEVLRFQLGRVDVNFSTMQYTWEQECLEKYSEIETMYIDILQKIVEIQLRIPSYSSEFVLWKDEFIRESIEKYQIPLTYIDINIYRLFPDEKDGEIFEEEFMEMKENGTISLKNEEIFKKRLQGLISYYAPISTNYPDVTHHPLVEIPMSNYQFNLYQIMRAIERLSEKASQGSSKKKGLKESSKSYFRIFSRQFSNFVFPESISRPFKRAKLQAEISKAIKRKLNPENTNENNKINITKEDLKLTANEDEQLSQNYLKRVQEVLEELAKNQDFLKNNKDGLEKYSPKMLQVLKNIQKSPGLVFFYSQFKTLEGLQCFGEVLKANSYEILKITNENKEKILNFDFPKKKRFAFYTGDEDYEIRKIIKNIYRDTRNKYGEYLQILMVTSAGAEGLDLKNIRQVHILEPYWNSVRTKQVIGRAVRLNSHVALPEKDRNVEIFEYASVLSEKQKKETKEQVTSDVYLYQVSKKKEEITERILQIMKEVAVDCSLLAFDHGYKYKCLKYNTDIGYAYLPSVYRNFVYQKTQPLLKKKKIEKKILLGGIDDKKQLWLVEPKEKKYYLVNLYETRLKPINPSKVKIIKKVGVDLNNKVVYEWQSITSGNLIKIGTWNEDSQFISK